MKLKLSFIFCFFIVVRTTSNTRTQFQSNVKGDLDGEVRPLGCAVKFVMLLCDKKSTSVENNFQRRINQTLTLITSILITMDVGCVHVILVCDKIVHFQRIEKELMGKWDVEFRNELKLELVQLEYPLPGKEWMRGL